MSFHPSALPIENRKDTRSPLLCAQAKAGTGDKVNFCPFGCEDKHLDEHGYCKHLVGFTNDGKAYEPMKRNAVGRRVVQVPTKEVGMEQDDDGVMQKVFAPVLPPVQKTDVLVPISVSSRVYRDVTKQAKAG